MKWVLLCFVLMVPFGCTWEPGQPLQMAWNRNEVRSDASTDHEPTAHEPTAPTAESNPAQANTSVDVRTVSNHAEDTTAKESSSGAQGVTKSNRAVSSTARVNEPPHQPAPAPVQTRHPEPKPVAQANPGTVKPKDTAVSVTETSAAKKFGFSSRYGVVTPTRVFSLATHINDALLSSPRIREHKRFGEIKSLPAVQPVGMKPEDVFIRSQRVADLVDRIRSEAGLEPSPRVTRDKAQAIPAECYLALANNVDGLVGWIAAKNSDITLGHLYHKSNVTGKKPDDVYALVDLAVRRLEMYLGLTASTNQ